jgi:hypothetical protein
MKQQNQKLRPHRSDRDIMRGTLFGRAAALVVNLGGSKVMVAKELLDLADFDPASSPMDGH